MSKNIEKGIAAVLLVLLITLIGYSVYFLYKKSDFYAQDYVQSKPSQEEKSSVTPTTKPTSTPTPIPTSTPVPEDLEEE